MAGLLDGYGIDYLDEIEAPSYDVPDNIYDFEVSDFYIRKGTDNYPDRSWIIISFSLGASGKTKDEWFQLPEDASAPTDKELEKLGYYKSRLSDLGIAPEQMSSVGPDDLIGLTGTLQVFTKNGYQNIKNVKLADTGENQFVTEEAPAAPAKRPQRRAAAAPAPEETDEAEVEEAAPTAPRAPVAAAATQKARSAGVKANPFA